jgi:Xaa-Pro aminopeptidase
MTFSNEPGIYLRGEFGVRLEDDMVITADRARLFAVRLESLERPFEGLATNAPAVPVASPTRFVSFLLSTTQ